MDGLLNLIAFDEKVPALAAFSVCAFLGLQILVGLLKVRKLDQQELLITGSA
jgi:hypothetical protein